jgi:hypothetical protein
MWKEEKRRGNGETTRRGDEETGKAGDEESQNEITAIRNYAHNTQSTQSDHGYRNKTRTAPPRRRHLHMTIIRHTRAACALILRELT